MADIWRDEITLIDRGLAFITSIVVTIRVSTKCVHFLIFFSFVRPKHLLQHKIWGIIKPCSLKYILFPAFYEQLSSITNDNLVKVPYNQSTSIDRGLIFTSVVRVSTKSVHFLILFCKTEASSLVVYLYSSKLVGLQSWPLLASWFPETSIFQITFQGI